MVERVAGRLQIYEVEEIKAASAICIVRCVGGIVRPGQLFVIESTVESPSKAFRVSLDWIECYGRRVEFVDPPHNARVQLAGDGVSLLVKGITISELEGT